MENIELVRIDDRMLHGQVVSTWLKDFLSRFEASNVPKRKGGRSLLPNPICYSN